MEMGYNLKQLDNYFSFLLVYCKEIIEKRNIVCSTLEKSLNIFLLVL